MTCDELRGRLLDEAAAPLPAQLSRYLAECGACRAFAHRLEAVRTALREHHAGVRPDARFADRVSRRLRGEPSMRLGWAAFRLLPVGAAALALLLWLTLRLPNGSEPEAAPAPTENLGWVLDQVDRSR